MDFDTLLYIFIIIISIIFSIYRNASKNKESDERPSRPIPDILEDEIFGTNQQEVVPEPETSRSKAPLSEDDIYENRHNMPTPVSLETIYEDESDYHKDDESVDIKSGLEFELSESSDSETDVEEAQRNAYSLPDSISHFSEENFEFDPVKAVIYSEILKKPNY